MASPKSSPEIPTSPKPMLRPRPDSVRASSARPLSVRPLSVSLAEDKIERAFDGFFARKQKGLSMTISELSQEKTPEVDDKGAKPPSPNYAPYVQEWPAEPAPIEHTPLYDLFIDYMLTAAPVLCIIYAIFAALLHKKPTASNYYIGEQSNWYANIYGPAMMEAQNFIPTIFPMIAGLEFARFIHALALWRIERGTRLGFVEQLMGSQSLGGTIASLWSLRIFLNIVGIALFCLWALVPVGGQAGLRIISNNGTLEQIDQLSYMSTNATPVGFQANDRDLAYYVYSVNGMYSSTMLTPSAASSPQDPWTNVKIPSIEWLERNGGCDSQGWCSFAQAAAASNEAGGSLQVTAGTWSSLTGVPVVGGIYGLGVQNFSMESSYYAFDCSSFAHIDPSVELTSALPNRSESYNTEADSPIWRNNASITSAYTFFIDTNTPVSGIGNTIGDARDQYVNNPNLQPRNITFGSRSPDSTSLARCGVTLTHVESEVVCNFTSPLWNLGLKSTGRSAAGACRVNQIRRSQVDKRPSAWTPLDESWSIPQRFFDSWPAATGNIPPGSSSPTERYINDIVSNSAASELAQPLVAVNWLGYAPNSTNLDETGNDYIDLVADLSVEQFTERFALLFNTYWHSFCNLQAITETEIGLGFSEIMPPTVMFNVTNVTMQLAGQYYHVSWAYLVVFLLCTLISLAAGCMATWLKYTTVIPDILGSVSTMTRENPFTPVPPGGSTLDGPEFARHVMHMPVRIVDTSPGSDVGHIALSTIEGPDHVDDQRRIRKGRLYI